MRKILVSLSLFLVVGITSTFAGLFPSVSKPNSPDASLIALQFSIDDQGELIPFTNTNVSMWTPVVKKEDGTIVEFRVFNGGVDMTTIYYKENLTAGKYTLLGFNHVYVSYDKLHKYEEELGKTVVLAKEPYAHKPYHVVQFFPLEQPYEFTLDPNVMMTLGHYAIKYKNNGGITGTTDDRYKVIESETKIVKADKTDQSLLVYMKQWATKKWKMWNAKNPAE
jgi:hypothetical protein